MAFVDSSNGLPASSADFFRGSIAAGIRVESAGCFVDVIEHDVACAGREIPTLGWFVDGTLHLRISLYPSASIATLGLAILDPVDRACLC